MAKVVEFRSFMSVLVLHRIHTLFLLHCLFVPPSQMFLIPHLEICTLFPFLCPFSGVSFFHSGSHIRTDKDRRTHTHTLFPFSGVYINYFTHSFFLSGSHIRTDKGTRTLILHSSPSSSLVSLFSSLSLLHCLQPTITAL